MFRGHHRQIRLLFGASDAIFLCIAFRLAYWIRERMELHFEFYILPAEVALLLVWSILVWIGSGYWWEVYDRIYLERTSRASFSEPRDHELESAPRQLFHRYGKNNYAISGP